MKTVKSFHYRLTELASRAGADSHHLTNVIPVQIALAGTSGETEFFSEGALGSTIAEFSRRAPAGTRVPIKTMTFTDACTQYGVPSYAKVDIEGAEIALFTGAAEFLCSHRIHFALDTNHYCDGVLTAKPVEAIFQRLGYHSESSDSSGFMTTWASPPGGQELKPWV
jgi:FkbM family methyltransferase